MKGPLYRRGDNPFENSNELGQEEPEIVAGGEGDILSGGAAEAAAAAFAKIPAKRALGRVQAVRRNLIIRGEKVEKEKRMLLIIKKVLFVLLAVDVIEAVLVGMELVGIFDQMAEFGQMVLITGIVIVAITVAVALYEILAKVFLIRSSSVLSSQPYDRKGHITAARFLLFFNIFSVVISLLSFGGEGATLYSQTRICIRIVSSLAEIAAMIVYLRTAKAIRSARRDEKGSTAR